MKLYTNLSKILSLFYINYEECKYVPVGRKREIEESFILTMRNVNPKTTWQRGTIRVSFILTMRNVNFLTEVERVKKSCSFILTMRNVN